MGLECERRHARKRWAENLEIFKKTSVRSRLWASRVGSLLGTSPVGCRMGTRRVGSRLGPCRRTVEVEFRPWCWEVWVSIVKAYGWVFRVPTSEDERRSKTPRDVPSVWVLLAWYDTKDNLRIVSLSPRVEEPKSEVKKLINVRTWTTVSSLVNVLCISLYLNLYMCRWIEISLWLWYDYGYDGEYTTEAQSINTNQLRYLSTLLLKTITLNPFLFLFFFLFPQFQTYHIFPIGQQSPDSLFSSHNPLVGLLSILKVDGSKILADFS